MNRFSMLILAPALGLGACAGNTVAGAAPVARFALAARLADTSPEPTLARVKSQRVLSGSTVAAQSAPGTDAMPPVSPVKSANGEAVPEPSRDRYSNLARVQAWTEGRLYRLDTVPERVSDIMLEPGEGLVSVAAGDTARWIIGETTSGSGSGRRTHILVKPTAAGLSTNLIIATDRRVYHVEVVSGARASMGSMSWTYPDDALLALRPGGVAASPALPGMAAGEPLNFGYSIEGDRPSWRPVRAYDDGHRVFIEFPAGLAQGEAPPLFVRAAGGGTELVNYRVRGRYYIVDRLFSAAELRLGEKPQQVVRITRATDRAGGRGSAS